MDAMAREIGDEGHFLFIYTREAHPEHFPDEFPALDSIERKFENARVMRERHGTREPYLRRELLAAIAICELKRNPDQRVVAFYHEGMSYDAGPRRGNRVTDAFFESAPA